MGRLLAGLGVSLGFCCFYQVIASYLLKLAGIEATYRRLPDISWVIHQETEPTAPDELSSVYGQLAIRR